MFAVTWFVTRRGVVPAFDWTRGQVVGCSFMSLYPALLLYVTSGPSVSDTTGSAPGTVDEALRSLATSSGCLAWATVSLLAWAGTMVVSAAYRAARQPLPSALLVWWAVSALVQVVIACLVAGPVDTTESPSGRTRSFVALIAAGTLVHAVFGLAGVWTLARRRLCVANQRGGARYHHQLDADATSAEAPKVGRRRSPVEVASCFSKLVFSWMSPLMALGFRKPLEMDDLPRLAQQVLCIFSPGALSCV